MVLVRSLLVMMVALSYVSAAPCSADAEGAGTPATGQHEAADLVPGVGQDYVIGPGDLLAIEVWKDPALTRTVVVLPDGRISFPLLGEMVAGGRSVADLKKELEGRIQKYVPDTFLTVEVKQSNSMHVYILGRVNNPGRQVLTCNINVLQALAMAGGLNPYAKKRQIRIFRQERGTTAIYPFDYELVTSGDSLKDNIQIQRGDVVFVP